MKRLLTLWIISCIIAFTSQAQVMNGAALNNNPVDIDLSNYDRDQTEDFIIAYYNYNTVLSDLNVQDSYKINKSLTKFVYDHIKGFYAFILNGVEQNTILTKSKVEQIYQYFLDTTISAISNTAFIDKPINGNDTPEKQINGPCVNMDFEDGSTNGWTLIEGDVDGTVPYSFVNGAPVGPGASHQIMGAGVDPVVGISTINPDGGMFSCRLGDGAVNGANAARMTQTFMVTPANSIFSYSYAVVFEDPGHGLADQPYFSVRVYDENGNNINCGTYNVVAAGGIPGFQNGPGNVLYKDWTTVFSQLNAYVGQNVTIEFTVGDCGLGGHYGYAYVDASCQEFGITTSTGDTVICAGDTMTLFAPAGGDSYLWNTGETTSSINITAGGHYSVDIIPVQGNQCSISLDIDIAELAVPTAMFTSVPSQICLGDSILFNDNSTITAPATIDSWQWNFGDGISTPASIGNILGVSQTSGTYTSAKHFFNTTGTYNVTLRVTSAGQHCYDTVMHQVQVNPIPVVSIVGDSVMCYGEQTTLTASGANTYSWDNGITNGVAFTPPVGNTIYTVIGTSTAGCTDTAQIGVTAYALPNVGYTVSDSIVCAGTDVTLSGTGANSYTWNHGISDGVSFSQGVGTTIYTVVGTDANGCEDSAHATIRVNALPTIGFTVSDDEVCDGTNVTLSGNGAGTYGNYSWDNGITDGVAFSQAVGTVTYTVTGTDANGCTDTAKAVVVVHALPNVYALGDTVCDGESVTLEGHNASSYTWNNGVIDGQAFVPIVGTTNYIVEGTDGNGCKNADTVVVKVNALPNVFAGNDYTICAGVTANLTGSGAQTYTWNHGVYDGINFQPLTTTNYTVTGTDENGCMNKDSVSIIVVPIPVVDFTADRLKGCAPLEPVFTNNSTGNLTNCQWTFSNGKDAVGCGSVSTTFKHEGCYDVTLTVSTPEGCTNTLTKQNYICVLPNPIADFYTDPKELSTINWTAGMINESVGGDQYRWDFGDGSAVSTEFDPIHGFPHDKAGTYMITLTVTSIDGCVDVISRPISVKDELIYYVPNAFTPDGDSYNETFKPVFGAGFDPQGYTLYIFNRWGDLLFESHNTDVGWDGTFNGKKCQDGVYIWKIIAKHRSDDGKELKIGNFTLLK